MLGKQGNGNTQVNSERENHNNRTDKLSYLGNTKSKKWSKKRRHRSI